MTHVPHDLDAERAVLGALLNEYASVGQITELLEPEDFHRPAHGLLFAALADLHRDGAKPSVALVRDQLARNGSPVDDQVLLDCVSGGAASPGRYVEILVRLSVARRMLGVAEQIRQDALANLDPDELVDRATTAVATVDVPADTAPLPASVSTVDTFLATAVDDLAPWVVPGLLRFGWRALLVAPEGIGKSVTARQIAICAAQGVHPFAHAPIPPVRTLIIDLENPDDAIAETCRPITVQSRRASTEYDEGRAWLWREPGGIDIRKRTDRRKLETVVNATRPHLVCIGPLYKLYRVAARESDEIAAGEAQQVLDDLRTRFGFSLLMEHHAPKSSGFGPRDLVPYGSSLWLRWPELGITLAPGGDDDPRDSVRVGRFRRDRMDSNWPDRLDRGGSGSFPWVGWWRHGMDLERTG